MAGPEEPGEEGATSVRAVAGAGSFGALRAMSGFPIFAVCSQQPLE